ncbi:MAG TPA: diguanylate cyclase [Gaiellaceae bacterium]
MDLPPTADNPAERRIHLSEARMPKSFRVKLAAYFLLLAVLPLAAAFWGFSSVTRAAAEQRVDARLGAELRAVDAAYRRELARAQTRARLAAERPQTQQQLARAPHRELELGPAASLVARRAVSVRAGRRLLGTVVALVPLDQALLGRLRTESGIAGSDRLLFVRHQPGHGASKDGTLHAIAASVSGARYRALTSGPLSGQPRVELALLAPSAAVASAAAHIQRQLLWILLGALLVLGAIAAAEGRSVMRSLGELASAAHAIGAGKLDRRVPVRGRDEFAQLAQAFNRMAAQLRRRLEELEVQRERLRASLDRTGELLGGTHDLEQLLPVIASAALETAGAEGALLIGEDGSVTEVGQLEGPGERIELPLASGEARFGILILRARELGEDELAATRALVGQAAIALENARLHETLEVKAISDGLTGLANRRRSEEFLAAEIARSERYATPLSVILGDIDGFKAANDGHGHGFGDLVLQQFASTLGETLRDVDLAGRWGGEEFLVVLPGTEAMGAVDAAERIRTAFAEHGFKTSAQAETKLTASFGVAEFQPGLTAEALVAQADEALYRAKRAGKNRVEATAGESLLSH